MSAKYIQIANLLKKLIEQNAGHTFRLPTESDLCQTYNVSRQTVRKALSVLENERLIEKRQGSGSYATGLLQSDKKNNIAILICSDTEYTYPELLADIRGTLQKHGFSYTVYVTDNQISKEREILQHLLNHPVRGILSEGCKTRFPTPNHDLYNQLAQKGISILFFSGSYSNLTAFPSIKNDDYEGGYSLGKYLVSLGHKKIGGIFKNDDIQSTEQCFGVLSALRDENITFCEECICSFDSTQYTALQKKQDTRFLADFASKLLKNVTAVVCCNDEIAYWLIKEFTYKQLRVPDDVSIVCFDRSYLSDLSSVQITSLSHQDHKIGITAAEAILKLVKGSSVSSQKLSRFLNIKHSSSLPPA